MELKEKIKKRQEANRKILNILFELVEKNPDLRLGQILSMLPCEIGFYSEPIDILDTLRKNIK